MFNNKKEEILQKSALLFRQISNTLDTKTEHIDNIRYYEDFFFGGANLEENNVYIVEIKTQNPNIKADKKEKNSKEDLNTETNLQIGDNYELELTTYEIYDENQNLIAVVDTDGNVSFSDEYLTNLENLPPEYYAMLDLSAAEFSLQEMTEKDIKLSNKYIEKYE